jgi:hypothetical protein
LQEVSSSEGVGCRDSAGSSRKDVSSSSDGSASSYADSQAATDASDYEDDELNDLEDEYEDEGRPVRSKQQQQRRKQSVLRSNTQPQQLRNAAAAVASAAHGWPVVAYSKAALDGKKVYLSTKLFLNIALSGTVPISVSYVVRSSSCQHGAATPAAAAAAADWLQAGAGSDTVHIQRLGPYPANLQRYVIKRAVGHQARPKLSGVRHSGELAPFLCNHAGQARYEVVQQEQVSHVQQPAPFALQ